MSDGEIPSSTQNQVLEDIQLITSEEIPDSSLILNQNQPPSEM
jgi:hypothetical protein